MSEEEEGVQNKNSDFQDIHVAEEEANEDDLLDNAADEFFDAPPNTPDAVTSSESEPAEPAQVDPFPLRRIRPLLREREIADGNYVADDSNGEGGGEGGGGRVEISEMSVERANACKENGNKHFASGELDLAASHYTDALRFCPKTDEYAKERAIYYCNRAACALALNPPRYEDAIYDCDRALELKPDYAKALARRSLSLESTTALDEALSDQQALLKVVEGPSMVQKVNGDIIRLQSLITERDEKLKNEMLDKLKGLGNSLLGNFGLSLDNFKAVKDEKTGSYSISFQR